MIKTAIILAGGSGERLRPFTEGTPKPMVKVGGYPMVEYQVAKLAEVGIKKIIFAAGYKAEVLKEYWNNESRIMNYGIEVVVSVEEIKLDTGGAIKKSILDHVKEDEPLIITNGDTFWPNLNLEEMFGDHQRMGGKATLLYVPLKTPWGISTLDENNKVIHFGEKKVIEGMWVSGGVYIADRSLVDLLPDVGPIEGEPFETLTQRGELYGYKYLDFWRAIDTAKDQTEVEKYLSENDVSGFPRKRE